MIFGKDRRADYQCTLKPRPLQHTRRVIARALADDPDVVSGPDSLITGKNTGKFIKLGVGDAQISRCFGDFRRDSLDNRTGNCWRENRETIFENREFSSFPDESLCREKHAPVDCTPTRPTFRTLFLAEIKP